MGEDTMAELADFRTAAEAFGATTEGVDDATCLRFLRARSMHINKAAKMFANYQTWRSSFVPLGYIPDEQVVSELRANKVALQGDSKKGYPIVITLACNHFPNKHETFKRYVVHLLDKAVASARPGVEKIFVMMDLNRLSYKNVDINGFIIGLQVLQNYYPERLGMLYMVNVPKIFISMWKVISRFVDKETKEKIVFLGDDDMKEVLLSEVDAAVLPSLYGGKAELVMLQDAIVPNWPPSSNIFTRL